MNPHPDYIEHRLLPDFVRAAAVAKGIHTTSYSDDWVLELVTVDQRRFVHGYRFDINSSAAGYNANDKVAAHHLLKQAGVPSVEHVMLDVAPERYPVVVKPLHGTGGRGVVLLRSLSDFQAWQAADTSTRFALSPFEQLTSEYRVILLDGAPLVCYEKKAQPTSDFTLHNLGQGAQPALVEAGEVYDSLLALAREGLRALGLRLAAVDIIYTPEGYKILEVNDGIMMEYFARKSDAFAAIAADAYAKIVDALF